MLTVKGISEFAFLLKIYYYFNNFLDEFFAFN